MSEPEMEQLPADNAPQPGEPEEEISWADAMEDLERQKQMIQDQAKAQARPAAPSSLTVANGGKGSVTLSWTDNASNEDNFLVERSTSLSAGYIQVAAVGANVRTYTDNTVFRKTTYFYRVRAANSGGKSGYSNVASVRTK